MGGTFDPPKYASHYPIKVRRSSQKKLPFQTRYRLTKHVKVVIIGIERVVLHRDLNVKLSSGWAETESETFLEHGALTKPIPPLAIADVDFGVKLEMSTPPNLSVNNVVNFICSGAAASIDDMMKNYLGARSRTDI